jgi:signal transduction histidine kinase
VERMTRLMEQMRSGARDKGLHQLALCELLNAAVDNRRHGQPAPTIKQCEDDLLVEADREHLTTVFTHIIQNAQEATTQNGHVHVRLLREGNNAVVEIEDDGIGMDEDFVRNRLFKPFDSTKGLTGMGIGAFESREFIRDLGGNIRVTSTPGEGSLFRIVLPCTLADTETNKVNPAVAKGIDT